MTLKAVRRRREGLSSNFNAREVYETLNALNKIEAVVDKIRYSMGRSMRRSHVEELLDLFDADSGDFKT